MITHSSVNKINVKQSREIIAVIGGGKWNLPQRREIRGEVEERVGPPARIHTRYIQLQKDNMQVVFCSREGMEARILPGWSRCMDNPLENNIECRPEEEIGNPEPREAL